MAKKAAAKKPAKKTSKKTSKKTTAAKAASKADDFRAKSADELSAQLAGMRKEQFNLRFQRANGRWRIPGASVPCAAISRASRQF